MRAGVVLRDEEGRRGSTATGLVFLKGGGRLEVDGRVGWESR